MRMWTPSHFVLAVAGCLIVSTPVTAAEIKILSANPLKEVLPPLASVFEKASGHKVTIVWGGTEAITKRIENGEAADIVLVGASNIDKLISQGKLVPGSRIDIAKSGVGVAVRTGLPKPDISTTEAVKTAVLAAGKVAYSSGPSGFYVAELLKRMGIADQIKNKTIQPASGVQVGELVARGEADLGFQQISELIHIKGIDYLGPLPPEIQNITIYAAGLSATGGAPEEAKALLKFFTSSEAEALIRKNGMDPG
jgi:molybdate transport system substrate-binding protein